MRKITILQGDCLATLSTCPQVHACVTSPPYYGLRDYGVPPSEWPEISYQPMPGLPVVRIAPMSSCLGLEPSPEAYVAHLVHVFRLVRDVLRDDGVLWLNIGDSYASSGGDRAGHLGKSRLEGGKSTLKAAAGIRAETLEILPSKNLMGIPWRAAFALQADGWYLRSDCIWHRTNCMPESVTDRPTRAHEYVFMLTKSERYVCHMDAVMELSQSEQAPRRRLNGIGADEQKRMGDQPNCDVNDGRNLRTVWDLSTVPFSASDVGIEDAEHYAVMSRHLADRCLKMALSAKGCCPTCGSQWVATRERTDEPVTSANGSRFDTGKTALNGGKTVQKGERFFKRLTGYVPTCEHTDSPIPCTVVDPFGGAGTTALCAARQGHHAVICEINTGSVRIAKARVEQDAAMLNRVDVIAAPLTST